MIQELLPFEKLVLMGDLNCDLLKTNSAATKSLLTILEFGNLVFNQDTKLAPTRITKSSASCIDFIVVDWTLPVSLYEVSDLILSDHFPVEAMIDVSFNQKITPVVKRSFKNVDMNELGLKVSQIQLENVDDPRHLNDQVQVWNQSFTSILDDMAPLRNFPRTKSKTNWIDNDNKEGW